jgi:hypothetical protein
MVPLYSRPVFATPARLPEGFSLARPPAPPAEVTDSPSPAEGAPTVAWLAITLTGPREGDWAPTSRGRSFGITVRLTTAGLDWSTLADREGNGADALPEGGARLAVWNAANAYTNGRPLTGTAGFWHATGYVLSPAR